MIERFYKSKDLDKNIKPAKGEYQSAHGLKKHSKSVVSKV
jgi:hypothetical protein